MRTELRRFRARADDGAEFVVIEYQNFTTFNPPSGPQHVIGGTRDLLLDDDRSVSYVDDETFLIVETGQLIRRV